MKKIVRRFAQLLLLTFVILTVAMLGFPKTAAASSAPAVTYISPITGLLSGGTYMYIYGAGFTGATGVSFGGVPATNFVVQSSTLITATVPAGSGIVDVTVTGPGGTSDTGSFDQFTYQPIVTGISPSGGPVGGGTTVTISGAGFPFDGVSGVSFGGVPATSFTVTGGTLTATSPAGSGTVDVTVTEYDDGTSVTSPADRFSYLPAVTGISPTTGPVGGGTAVTISGSGFTGATGVSFGGVTATSFTVNSDTSITATSPAGSAGTADVTVTGPTGTSVTGSADRFTYSANELVGWWKLGEGSGTTAADSSGYGYGGMLTNPAWSGDNPYSIDHVNASLDFSGGTSSFTAPVPNVNSSNVSISAWVKWNGSAASDYQPIAYNGNPGHNGYGLFLDNSGKLEVLLGGVVWLPTTASLSPSTWQHVALVGTPGSGTENWTVYLNGIQADQVAGNPIASASGDNMLIGYAANATSFPTYFPGLIDDVRLYAAALTSTQIQQLAEKVPGVTGISPTTGPVGGGTVVTISGSYFTGATGVSFDGVAATSFTVNSDTSITATSPARSAGTVDVTVTGPYGTSATGPADRFAYLPVVTGISSTTGPVGGGTAVTISGSGFTGATGVSFGGVAATSFTVNSDTSVTATSPAGSAGTADVTVITPGGTSATGPADRFTYSANELVGWWKFGEGSGTTAADSSGYGYGGTLVSPVWSTDHPNSVDQGTASLDFSGGSSTFTAPMLTFLTKNVSISAWVKWNGTTGVYQPIAYCGNPRTNGFGLFLDTGGKLNVLLGGVGWLPTTATLPVGAWAHVAAVADGSGNWIVYLNGSRAGQVSGGMITPSDNFLIGYSADATATPTHFSGLISDVGIYATALTAEQVQQIYSLPGVTGVSPTGGNVNGGTAVTITGINFTDATGVSFGSVAATSFTVNSDTSITAVSPAQAAAGTVDVTVTNQYGTSITSSDSKFICAPTAAVTGISQAKGPVSGGTIVAVIGSGFTLATGVSFGGTAAASFTINSDTSITAVSSAQAAGTVDVTVTTLGGTSASGSGDQFTYSDNTLIGCWKLGEGSGSLAADSSGYGYNGTLTSPVWSTDHPNSVDLVTSSLDFSGGSSTFTAPIPTFLTKNVSISAWVKWNGTTGVYQPIVYNGNPGANGYGLFLDKSGYLNILCGGQAWLPTAATLPVGTWTHVAAVEDGSGNWTVYLNGSQAGQVSGSPIAPSGNMIIGYTSNLTPTAYFRGQISGVRVYAVALTLEQIQQLAGKTLPTVSGISPYGGPVSGGTTVTITGSGFAWATGVSFGGVAATSFTVNSDISITAVTPAQAESTVDVTVTNQNGASLAVTADKFSYVSVLPVVTAVSPTGGPVGGKTVVTINGSDFTGATGVSFGGVAAESYTINSDTSITAVSSAQAAGTVDVLVEKLGATSTVSSADKFTYSTGELVGWWKLGEGTGTAAADSAGYGYDGTLTSPVWSSDHTPDTTNNINASLDFSGGSSLFTASIPTVSTGNVSISAWVKWNGTAGTYQPIVYNGNPGTNGYGLLLNPSGKLNVLCGGKAWLPTTATLPVGVWAHVAAVEDSSGNWTVYLNGSAVGQLSGSPYTPTGNMLIGYASNATTTATWFHGLIDDVQIYTAALTQAQVRQLVAVPAVSGITPANGNVSGGTTVTLTGVNFTGATGVSFGGVAATSFTVESDTTITAVSPGHASGAADVTVTNADGTSAGGSGSTFTYCSTPEVTGISPTSGNLSGGASVTISGSSFTTATGVSFGSTAATSFTVKSDTTITAVSPAQAVGTVDVIVTTPYGTSTAGTGDEFTYSAAPEITGISLASGPLGGGTTVSITGKGFTDATGVSFGGVTATSFTAVSDTSITAVSPAQAAGAVDVTVTTTNGTSTTCTADKFTYISAPQVTGVSPGTGYISGGTSVTITGNYFSGATGISFGGVAATSFSVGSDTSITAVLPAHAAGPVDVTVTTPYGTSAVGTADKLTYSSDTLMIGCWKMGEGSGNTAADSSAYGHDAVLTNPVWSADYPASAGSSVASLDFSGGSSQFAASLPTNATKNVSISAWVKWNGTIQYGPIVYIGSPYTNGYGLYMENDGTLMVELGGVCSTNTHVTLPVNSWAHVALVADSSGKWTIYVNSVQVQQITYSAIAPTGILLVGYQYSNSNANWFQGLISDISVYASALTAEQIRQIYAIPQVTGVSPAGSSTAGSSAVTITGYNFTGATGVSFGGVAATSFTVDSDTSITAVSPTHAAGTVDVTVSNKNGTSLTGTADAYTYSLVPTVGGVSPAGDSTAGGATVTITGYNFTGATGVSFGTVAATSFTVVNDTSITAVVPAQSAGAVDVTVSNSNGTSTTGSGDVFTYAPVPSVSSLSAASGNVGGGTAVTITGYNFTGATGVSFGGVAATGFAVDSDTSITALAPAHAAGTVDVTVNNLYCTSVVVTADKFTYSTNNLVGWWKLGEGTGNTAADSSSYGYDGTLASPVWSADHPNSIDQANASIDFGGGGSQFTAPLTTAADGNVSISAWVKWNGTTGVSNYQPIVYVGDPGGNGYGLFLDGSGNLEILCGGIAWLNTTIKLTPNTWQHVALVGAAGSGTVNWTVYLNGSQAGSVSSNTIAPAIGGKTIIGYATNATSVPTWFPGLISDVRIYASALTSAQVVQLATMTESDTTLSGLTISSGSLTPAFDPSVTAYTASVVNSVTGVTVTPTANQSSATVKANGTATASGSASGTISLNVGNNIIEVEVTAPDGTTTKTYTITVTRTAPSTSGTISGTVKDSNNNPVSGANVSLTVSGSVYSAQSAADGTYSILNVPAGTGYTVTASKAGFNNGNATNVSVTANTATSDVNITLTAIPTATHTVSISANPAAGGNVTGGGIYNEGTSVTVTASVYSGYTFVNWTEGGSTVSTDTAYTFTLSTSDRTLAANFIVTPPDITTGTISGMVTDGANPVSGANVSVTVSGSVYSAATAGDGSYSILNVPAGTGYTVTAGLTGYTNANKTNVNVTANTATSGINFILSAIPPTTYTVSIASLTGGSITASPSTATSGTAINLTITPDSGMQLKAGTLKYNDGTTDYPISGASFTMPATNVTVSAEFEAIPPTPTPTLKVLTLSGTIPNLTVGQAVYDLNNLSLNGTDQYGDPFSLSGQTVQWNLASGNAYAGLTGSLLTPLAAGSGTVTATVYGVASNPLGFTVMAPRSSGGNNGGGSQPPSPPTPSSTTVTGNVTDGTTGAKVSSVTATVTANTNGSDTISMSSAHLAVLRQPDGTISPLSALSHVAITGATGIPVPISADGTIQMVDLAKGTDNNFNITYDLDNGQKITIATMEIKIDSSGNVTLTTTLIDPYGIITDATTGKALAGVNVTLYYADTERNKATGKTPDTVVALPSIAGFKPNNNQDPQTSDSSGAYGFMVFPATDYYIVATKDGYAQYTSPTISVEQEIVHWDFKMSPTISGVTRLAGRSRVDTALAIAQAEYPGKIANVVLATADNYPDALAGSVLACKVNSPILLVGSSAADQKKVLDYLKSNLDPSGTVYILGGTAAVSSAVESEVQAAGFTHITRIAGADRYETSAQIAAQLQVMAGTPLVLVSGANYPDALSVSSIAAQMQFPVLLVPKDGISDSVSQEIAAIKPSKVYIIGGEGVISSAVENQVAQLTGLAQANIVRIGGTDRYATSLAVAQYFNSSGQNVCLATGDNFPDALAGSVYAAHFKAPIILVDSSLADQAITYLKTRKLTGAAIFGGEAAVSQDIEQQLAQLIGKGGNHNE